MPSKTLPRDILLPFDAKAWVPLEAALFVLSRGKFDAPKERERLGNQGGSMADHDEPLISVTCPTSERRQNFHPLLYIVDRRVG